MAFWGLAWTNAKILGQYTSPQILILIRFFIASVSFFPILLLSKEKIILNKSSYLLISINALLITIYNYFYFIGTLYGEAGLGGVIVTTLNPVFTTIISLYIFKTLINMKTKLGLLLGVISGILTLNIFFIDIQTILTNGNIYFILSALVWAIVTIFTSKYINNINFYAYTFWSFFIAFIICIPLTISSSVLQYKPFDLVFWVNMLAVSLGAMTFGTSIYFYSSKVLGAQKASSYTFVVPLFSIVFAFIILNEAMAYSTLFGGAMSMISIYLINKK